MQRKARALPCTPGIAFAGTTARAGFNRQAIQFPFSASFCDSAVAHSPVRSDFEARTRADLQRCQSHERRRTSARRTIRTACRAVAGRSRRRLRRRAAQKVRRQRADWK
eukprot:3885442-Pleurochrysis_carterae.AAC.1